MYPTTNDLPEAVRSKVSELCNARLAEARDAERVVNQADDVGDTDTADIFTEIARGTDKWLWFVQSHLQDER